MRPLLLALVCLPLSACSREAPAQAPLGIQALEHDGKQITALDFEGIKIECHSALKPRPDGAPALVPNGAKVIAMRGYPLWIVDSKLTVDGREFGAVKTGDKVLLADDGVRVNGELRGALRVK